MATNVLPQKMFKSQEFLWLTHRIQIEIAASLVLYPCCSLPLLQEKAVQVDKQG